MPQLAPPTRLPSQFESSAPSSYTITGSKTLRQLLEAQAASAKAPLAQIEGGNWTRLAVDMSTFGQPGSAGSFFKADRITLGFCLQNLADCGQGGAPPLLFCIDRVVLVSSQ